jgi:membrane protein YdbS with pleckstrin-like domain
MVEDLTKKVYTPSCLRGVLSYLSILLPCLIFLLVISPKSIITLIFSFLFPLCIFLVYLSLKVQSYELREDGIFIKMGIIAKKQILILYSEIQDVEERQLLTDKIFGIENLKVLTLAKLRLVTLSSLKRKEAKEIKEFLLAKSAKEKVEREIKAEEKEKPKTIHKEYKIHPLKKTLFSFLFICLIVFSAIFSFSMIIPFANFIAVVIGVFGFLFLFFIIFIISSAIEMIAFKLNFTEDAVSIGREFLGKDFANLPYEKIQDIGIFRGPLDRLLGLAGITIETGAGIIYARSGRSSYPLNRISNLYQKDALEIREFVLKKSGIKNLETESLREKFPLEKRKILKKSISLTFWAFVAIGIITSIIYSIEPFWGNLLLNFLIIFPFVFFPVKLIHEIFYFKNYHYSENNEVLVLRKGVITITEVTIPYNKVQNIFVNQDLFDRIFKLYDVHLSTIGTVSQMELHIDGVSKETAEKLRDWLLNRIKVRK